ncbi:MAG: DMT family transporter [Longimicrobiales bacterium]|nr:DMT family transporter [Longimicrobiales bacterium]
MRIPPLASVHVAVLLFGAAGLFGKLLALHPVGIVLGRVVFATLFLGALLRARGAPLALERARDAVGMVGLGMLLAAHWVTFFHAIQLSSVAIGLLTFSTFPIFTAVLEPLLLRERWSWGDAGAALVTFVGVALVVPEPAWSNSFTRGAVWGVVSGLTFALLSIANRGLVRRYPPLVLAFHQDLWAAVALLPFLGVVGAVPGGRDLLLLVLLGVVFTAGAHSLFIHGLREVRARTASVIATLEPVYGIAFALLLLGEVPAGRTVLGGAVILAAATWVSLRGGRAPESGTPAVAPGSPPAPREG